MAMVSVTVRGATYFIPQEIWVVALRTFEQQYKRFGGSVPQLARAVASELMPVGSWDPFSEERLTRCLLSHFGKRGGKKKKVLRASLPKCEKQLTLF